MSAQSAPTPEMLSIREFARRDGCDESRVCRAIRTGHLKRSPAGKLDAALVGTGWRETNRRTADTPATRLRTGATGMRTVANVRTEEQPVADYPNGLAAMATCAAYSVAMALAGHLSRPAVDGIVDQVTAGVRREATLLLSEEGVQPPPGCASWSTHPLFTEPPLVPADWDAFADLVGASEVEPPPVLAERILSAAGATRSRPEAERVEKNYAALLRQLEYEQKAALLLSTADVEAVCGHVLDITRTRYLALPTKVAPLLASASTPAAMLQILTQAVHEILEELASTEVVVERVKTRAAAGIQAGGAA